MLRVYPFQIAQTAVPAVSPPQQRTSHAHAFLNHHQHSPLFSGAAHVDEFVRTKQAHPE